MTSTVDCHVNIDNIEEAVTKCHELGKEVESLQAKAMELAEFLKHLELHIDKVS